MTRFDFGAMPIYSYDAATRDVLFTLGIFPQPTLQVGGGSSDAPVQKFDVVADPFQYGQPGLIPILGRG